MCFKFTAKFLIASLTFAVLRVNSAVAQPVVSPPSLTKNLPEATIFKCIPYSNEFFITVARNGEREAALFIWSSHNFSSDIPPQEACNSFSQRLSEQVTQNKGTLKNLLFTMGRVSDRTVLCLVHNYQEGCNTRNTLFTLNPEDAKQYNGQPYKFVEYLTNFRPPACDSQILQFVGNPIIDIERQFYFSLEIWQNKFLLNETAIPAPPPECVKQKP
jgi:hypothetical protein